MENKNKSDLILGQVFHWNKDKDSSKITKRGYKFDFFRFDKSTDKEPQIAEINEAKYLSLMKKLLPKMIDKEQVYLKATSFPKESTSGIERHLKKDLIGKVAFFKELLADDKKLLKLWDRASGEKVVELIGEELEGKKTTLHRQARGYLKTTARLVGKETEQVSLFTLPAYNDNINPFKQILSKNTAITGQLLLALWQKNKDDKEIYKINNLSEIARLLQTTPQELKLYLICLGGYQYPITHFDKEKRILSIHHDKLFYIKFNIRLKENETESSFNADNKIGTDYLSFIKERDIESVDVMPSPSMIQDLQGKGLGNVLVDDYFVAFSLGLSDMAYKLFAFSSSNKPTFKIGFKKLITRKYLNLEKQVFGVYNKQGKRLSAGQGKARVLDSITKGLKELKEAGHLVSWKYSDDTDYFEWRYSNKIIKHKELLLKNKGDQTGQTGQQTANPTINTIRQTINTIRQFIDTIRQGYKITP